MELGERILEFLLSLGINRGMVEMLGDSFIYVEVHSYAFNDSGSQFAIRWVKSKLDEKFPEIREKEVALCAFEIEYG